MFKLAVVEIDIVYGQTMYEMIEQGSTGGMLQTCFLKVEETTI